MSEASPRVVLGAFEPVTVHAPVPQEVLLSYTAWLMATARCAATGTTSAAEAGRVLAETQAAVLRYGVGPHHIAARQFNALPQTREQLGATGALPALPPGFEDIAERPHGPTLDRRMGDFEALALDVLRRWYAGKQEAPDHLIHVTCSGYASPSPAQRLASQNGWHDTVVTHSYHMGCYGAFPAIRNAIGLLAPSVIGTPEPVRRVDLVHTEYLSAHLTTLPATPGDIIDSTLFADGFIGYSASREDFHPRSRPGLRILAHVEKLIPDSLDQMTWRLGPHHFDMHLSKAVPLSIREALLAFVERLCARAGVDFGRDKGRMAFAIHPGGPRILDHACDVLGISEEQIRHARQVFHELGNMSSATVPYILMRQLADDTLASGTHIVAVAFGPGLTATGLLLEKM